MVISSTSQDVYLMKPFKILLWAGISFTFGKGLNLLFSPSEVFYSFLLFSIPFIVIGFQQDIKITRTSSSIFGKRFRVKAQTTRVTTFWGIPVGQPEVGESVDEWFPDTTPQEALEAVSSVTETLIGSTIKGILRNKNEIATLPGSR